MAGQEKKLIKEVPNVQWDMVKVQDGGLEPKDIEKGREQMLAALTDGFEPFAVVPTMMRKSAITQEFVQVNWVYFKRPSIIKEAVDDTPRIET